MPAGRPTKYKPEYCDLLVSMLSNGASLIEFCAEVGICKQTLYNWKDDNPEFLDSYTQAIVNGQAYWEKWLRTKGMTDNKANAPLVKLYFANRFGWSDKQEVDSRSSDGSMTPPTRIEIVSGDHGAS